VAFVGSGQISRVAFVGSGQISRVAFVGSGQISRVAFVGSGKISRVAFVGSGEISRVAFVGSGLIRRGSYCIYIFHFPKKHFFFNLFYFRNCPRYVYLQLHAKQFGNKIKFTQIIT
jgi:hypothetical protein